MEVVRLLIQYFSWPLVTLIFLFLFRSGLQGLLARLKFVKAGSVEFQLSEQLHAQGLTKKQLKLITSFSADELDLFLLASFTENIGFNYQTTLPPDVFKARLLSLQEAGLIQIINPEDPGTNLRHNVTPLGRRVRAMLISGSTQLLRGVT